MNWLMILKNLSAIFILNWPPSKKNYTMPVLYMLQLPAVVPAFMASFLKNNCLLYNGLLVISHLCLISSLPATVHFLLCINKRNLQQNKVYQHFNIYTAFSIAQS